MNISRGNIPIKVWGRKSGFHARKVLWTLEELNLDYELIDAGYGTPPTPELIARNPNTQAPTIDDNGMIVWESNVIVRYLCTRYSNGVLIPQDLTGRFAAEQWMEWNTTNLWPALRPIHHQIKRQKDHDIDQEKIKNLEKWLEILDEQLAKNRFIIGKGFTIADISVGITIQRLRHLEIKMKTFPNVERWYLEITARTSFISEEI